MSNFGFSDQGEGSEWTEDWEINSDGTINIIDDDRTYKNFEEFKSNW